jgi:hypothetical protein
MKPKYREATRAEIERATMQEAGCSNVPLAEPTIDRSLVFDRQRRNEPIRIALTEPESKRRGCRVCGKVGCER